MSNLFLTIYESEDDKILNKISVEQSDVRQDYQEAILRVKKELEIIEDFSRESKIAQMKNKIKDLETERDKKLKSLEEKKGDLPHTFTKTNRHINFNAIEYTDLVEENPEYTRVWTYKGIKSYVKTKSLFPLDAIFEDIKE